MSGLLSGLAGWSQAGKIPGKGKAWKQARLKTTKLHKTQDKTR